MLGLVYGYVPFFIAAAVRRPRPHRRPRCSRRRATSAWARRATFLRVTLPLSRQGMLAAAVITALPMIGDYYTADLLSGSPRTSMIGNQIEFYLFQRLAEGGGRVAGASSSRRCCWWLMYYYLRSVDRASERDAAMRRRERCGAGGEDPWRRPVVPRHGDVAVRRCGRSCPC